MSNETLQERLRAAANAKAKAAGNKPSPRQQRELGDLYDEGKAIIQMGGGNGVTTKPKRWSWTPGSGE